MLKKIKSIEIYFHDNGYKVIVRFKELENDRLFYDLIFTEYPAFSIISDELVKLGVEYEG